MKQEPIIPHLFSRFAPVFEGAEHAPKQKPHSSSIEKRGSNSPTMVFLPASLDSATPVIPISLLLPLPSFEFAS